MDSELRDNWIAALESGEYAQGLSFLRRRRGSADTYCCLGVLCELVGAEFPDDVNAFDYVKLTVDGETIEQHNSEKFSEKTCSALGLDKEFADDLANRNDGIGGYHEHSFADIAKILRKTL